MRKIGLTDVHTSDCQLVNPSLGLRSRYATIRDIRRRGMRNSLYFEAYRYMYFIERISLGTISSSLSANKSEKRGQANYLSPIGHFLPAGNHGRLPTGSHDQRANQRSRRAIPHPPPRNRGRDGEAKPVSDLPLHVHASSQSTVQYWYLMEPS